MIYIRVLATNNAEASRALRPNISMLHAWVADRNGNALFTPPYGEGFYGAMAASGKPCNEQERVREIRQQCGWDVKVMEPLGIQRAK